MIKNIEELKIEISKRIDNIEFHPHFYDSIKKRPYLSEELVKLSLKGQENYRGFQIQEFLKKIRYRIGIELSGKYTLVIVVEFRDEGLYIITAWKTDRKWQKATQK